MARPVAGHPGPAASPRSRPWSGLPSAYLRRPSGRPAPWQRRRSSWMSPRGRHHRMIHLRALRFGGQAGRALATRGPPRLRLGLLEWLETTRLAIWLGESPSVWAAPTVLTLHTTGMAVLVGASWLLDMRLLGLSRHVPLSAFRWVFPTVAFALVVNLTTG